jgi:uncharacterized protein (TIGR02118 family)
MVALASGLGSASATAGQSSSGSCSAKVVFVLHRRADLSHEQCLAEWIGPVHTAIVRRVPSLCKWVQNHPSSPPNGTPDGIGELWFESAEAMGEAMKSPQMGAAVEDAKRFLDMEKTYAIVVAERTIIA